MSIYYQDESVTLHLGDALEVARTLPDESVNCVVTSPPYFGHRDYGIEGQYGHEETPQEFADTLVELFREVHRVLATDGTVWLNLGDSYGGGGIARPSGKWPTQHDPADRANGKRRSFANEKCLLGVPDKVAESLVDSGWVIRNRIIWVKGKPTPSNARDRFNSQYEYIFLLVKRDGRRPRYHFDRSTLPAGDVWEMNVAPFPEAHFATFPIDLPRRCIAAGCPGGGTVLDPFSGSGTTGMAALEQGKKYIGIDLNADYLDLSLRTRLLEPSLDFGGVS